MVMLLSILIDATIFTTAVLSRYSVEEILRDLFLLLMIPCMLSNAIPATKSEIFLKLKFFNWVPT